MTTSQKEGNSNSTRRLVAVKKLQPSANEATKGDFIREIKIMSKLRHSNIVQVRTVVLVQPSTCLPALLWCMIDVNLYVCNATFELLLSLSYTSDRTTDHCCIYCKWLEVAALVWVLRMQEYIVRNLIWPKIFNVVHGQLISETNWFISGAWCFLFKNGCRFALCGNRIHDERWSASVFRETRTRRYNTIK